MREPWTELQISCRSCPADVSSRLCVACNAIRSHVASRKKYLQATCIAPRGTSEWLSLHTVEMAITPSFTPHWLQVMSVDTHIGACRDITPPVERRSRCGHEISELHLQPRWLTLTSCEWHWPTFVFVNIAMFYTRELFVPISRIFCYWQA